jgi:hypothetical protein
MRNVFIYGLIGLIFTACVQWFSEPYPDLVVTQKENVADCTLLGIVTETADAANPFPRAATANMITSVRARSGQLGATHIVWLHKTATMAAAEAYECR